MKKLIGSLVGAILVFAWQFLSWTMLKLHEKEAKYTSGQDSVLTYLSSALKEDGIYMLPTVPPGTPESEAMEMGKKMDGKHRYENFRRFGCFRPCYFFMGSLYST